MERNQATSRHAVQFIKMIKDRAKRFMTLLDISDNDSFHLTGITCFASTTIDKYDWIIDTRANDHVTPFKELQTDITQLVVPFKVFIQDGLVIMVTHTGCCVLTQDATLKNILLILSFNYNLIGVSKLASNLKLKISFTDQGCYIQDLTRQTTLWIGEAKQ